VSWLIRSTWFDEGNLEWDDLCSELASTMRDELKWKEMEERNTAVKWGVFDSEV
jgi:hypothetical protein